MKLITFTGSMGCGKSTAIKFLEEYSQKSVQNIKFAQPLYDMQEYIYNRINSAYKRPETFTKDRKLLQWLGTEWGRTSISPEIWVYLWSKKVEELSSTDTILTCDDVRYDNEAQAIIKAGGFIIKLVSDTADARINTKDGISNHISENGISDKYVDFCITNNDTIEEFKERLFKVYDIINTCHNEMASSN